MIMLVPNFLISMCIKMIIFSSFLSRFAFQSKTGFNMRFFSAVSAASLLLGAALAAPSQHGSLNAPSFNTFSSKVVYVPDANYTDPRVLYARTVELPGGVLLSTWENYSPGTHFF